MTSSFEPVSDAKPTHVRYGVLGALCLGASIAYLSRNCLGVAVADGKILTDLACSEAQMAWIMGPGFFLAYALFQIPSGWLGQAWGSRHLLPTISILSAIFTGLMGLVFSFVSALVVYLSIGMVQAGIFPNSANTIKKWFPVSQIAIASGALGSFMSVGAAIAVAMSGVMLELFSWRVVLWLFMLPGIVWAIAFYVWFRDSPEQQQSVNRDELDVILGPRNEERQVDAVEPASDQPESRKSIPWAAIFSSPAMWMIAGQQFFRAAGYIFYSTWFPTYLKQTRNVTTKQSGLLSSLPLLAVIVGSLLGGVVVDWILARTGSRRLSRQLVAVLSMLSCAGFVGLAYFTSEAETTVLLISAGSFCAAFGGPCAYAVTIDMAGKHVPIVFSIMNMTGNLGAAACPLLVAWFVDATGKWDYVLFFFVGIYVAAAICWGLLNPQGSIFDRHRLPAGA